MYRTNRSALDATWGCTISPEDNLRGEGYRIVRRPSKAQLVEALRSMMATGFIAQGRVV